MEILNRNRLNQYRESKSQLDELREELAHYSGITAIKTDRPRVKTSKENPAEKTVLRRLELSERVERLETLLITELDILTREILKIDNLRLSRVIMLRAIRGYTWEQVAESVGDENPSTTERFYYKAFSSNGDIKKSYLQKDDIIF